ncbi:tetratricopeptide repeat protein [Clostridium paraputrificum]|uniref:tetratricopeptide repeat protein n=1 Tax=Clostridium TaxID=1485 RepID=UPI003D33C90E
MDKFTNGLKGGIRDLGMRYKKLTDKNPKIDTVVTLVGVMLFAFLVMFICQKAMGSSAENIATNNAEAGFYERDYDTAISEYEKLQEGDEWPLYTAKLAEVYSVKGDYVKSNKLLEEAYEKRNNLIDKNGKKKYNNVDGDLGNYLAFTALMNGDNKRALEYGEIFMEQNKANKGLERTMFTIYMVNGEIDKAKALIEEYPVDKESAYDLAIFARMNILVDDWDKGLDTLKEAWYKNKDEIKVFDVIAQIAAYNKDDIIKRLSELSEKNPDEIAYKVWLIKCYSMLEATTDEANRLLEEVKGEDLGNVVFNTVIAKIYQHSDRKEEAEEILNNIIKSEKDSFIGYHTAAWYYLDMGDPDKAFELCKKSILENKDYPDNYGFLIPEIMMKKKQSEIAEPYFRTALLKEPFNYNIMLKIADYYWYTAENGEKAYEYFNLASLVKPNDPEIYYNMAMIKLKGDKEDEAIELLKKCISIDETSTKYHRTLGTVYLNQEKNAEAIKEIRAAYAVDKSDISTLNNAGCFYISIEGDIERGMTNLKAAYDGLLDSTDIETRNTITENYQKAKELYDAYNKNDGSKLTVPEFNLFY